MSKVVSYQLTQEEQAQLVSGEKTYEEIIANKEPITREVDLSKLTKESYTALIHEGYTDREIRKRFNLKVTELDKLKANWNQAYKHKMIQKRIRKEVKQMEENGLKQELTRELYEQHIAEGMTNKEIMEKYGYDHNKYYKLKREWGLIGSKPAMPPKVITVAKHEEVVRDLKNQLQKLHDLRSEDVKVIDELKEQIEKDSSKIMLLENENQKLRIANDELRLQKSDESEWQTKYNDLLKEHNDTHIELRKAYALIDRLKSDNSQLIREREELIDKIEDLKTYQQLYKPATEMLTILMRRG